MLIWEYIFKVTEESKINANCGLGYWLLNLAAMAKCSAGVVGG